MTDTAAPPEDPDVQVYQVPLASWSRRAVAALLDGATFLGAARLVPGTDGGTPPPTFGLGPAETVVRSWLALLFLVGLVLTMLALQGWTGATPGKRVAGIAIVRDTDGVPAGIPVSVARVLAHTLDYVILIGFLRPIVNRRAGTFADSIVRTIAIQTREPRAHPRFARYRRPPSALRSAAVTFAALVVCALGVLWIPGTLG